MLPYKPLSFDPEFVAKLKVIVLNLTQSGRTDITIKSFGSEFDALINQQLHYNQLPSMRECMIFQRIDRRSADYQSAHIDGNGSHLTHCSVVVPIAGCECTALCWFTGLYVPVPSKFHLNGVATHYDVQWHNIGRLVHSLEIVDKPYLCKVDIPHDYYRNPWTPRITCTFRLSKNPTFESLQ